MWVGGSAVHRPGSLGESRFRVQFLLLGLGFQRMIIVNPDIHSQVFQEACKGKVLHPISSYSPPPPSSSTSSSPSPKNSFPNKSDGDLTDHSFYHSEANSEPTKEQHTKKLKAAKEPTSSSGKKKEASKQASKNPSPPPPYGSSPSPSSDPQDEPEEYSKKFKASGHVALDPLAIHNICNVDREFKVPKRFPVFS
ncbi:hypothetical protein DSO57_1030719 [Entomophthora muscae]|uniref:Uncharacterized protein n=1 Tax=Entomophthora muscae TaxID=34485 RepID=A0ACC2UAM1_9FUNG|nr:hypothetical protein DSO57_1030719 [Entomophthora muscae]